MSKILVTGAGGFIGKYILLALERGGIKREDIDTLGISPDNRYRLDLTKTEPHFDTRYDTVIHLVGSCFSGDPRALNVYATRNLTDGLSAIPPRHLVYLSSVEIYGRTDGESWSEADIVDPVSPVGITKYEAEQILDKWAATHNVTLTILRLPAVIGTGMKGPMRTLVNRIYRGSFHHIAGNEARMSVVHAVDVAQAAIDLADKGGIYNLTDGVNPTLHDLTEALAHRLNDKKIMTLSVKRARRWATVNDFIPGAWFTRKAMTQMMTTLTFSADKAIAALGRKPLSVTDYLMHHNYDNDPF